ncbi:synaptic vesicle 2-related protein-like [Branchiostoma lanceolatum]|uniref:synaptic vesicle 2-related protein-like n=1 Tax=Branchiostoma lanceolatum TaxID=7740 RepID=UPI0034540632
MVRSSKPTQCKDSERIPLTATGHRKGQTRDTFTVEDAVEELGFGRFQIKLYLWCGLAYMAIAMEIMIITVLSSELQCEWHLSSWHQAFLSTSIFIGIMIGAYVWGKFADKYGRRTALMAAFLWLFFYGILSAFAPTFSWLLVLRVLVGFGTSSFTVTSTLCLEFFPRRQGGQSVMFLLLFWAAGSCLEVGLAVVVLPSLGWRWLLVFTAVPSLVVAVWCKWIPESARYHVAGGQQEKARQTLKRIAQENKSSLPPGKLVVPVVTEKRGQFRDLFTKELRLTTVLLWFIWIAAIMSYYGIALMTTELFRSGDNFCEAGRDQSQVTCHAACNKLSGQAYMNIFVTTLAELPGTFLLMLIMTYLPRKPTMALALAGFSLFTFMLLTCAGRAWLTVFIFVARAFISGGSQLPFVYTPEVYPTMTRALGIGTCSAVARVGAILTPFVAQVMLKFSVHLTVSVYGTICLLAAVACLLLPIETKGRSMQETGQTTQPQSP